METAAVFAHLKEKFGEAVRELVPPNADPVIVIDKARVHDICRELRDARALAFDYLISLSGLDLTDRLFMVYHLGSLTHHQRLTLKAELSYADAVIDTVSDLWPAANWHEREQYDMFGITFAGHPDLRRILLPEDWVGHPLRKDYKFPDGYHGITATRPSPLEQFAAQDAAQNPSLASVPAGKQD